jgi:hypothetical protein
MSVIDDFGDILHTATPAAQEQAAAALRNQNKNEWQCDLTIIGNTRIVSGVTFMVEGFGVFDGKYIADNVTHSISGGYTTQIKGHRVLDGY